MTDNLYTPDKIRTFSGKYIDPLNPDPALICIEDIAHALSMLPRFGGHLPYFYSVAQHSTYCAEAIADPYKFDGLMHDAGEAYLLDIPKPVKARIADYEKAEDNLMRVIAAKFGFTYPKPAPVKVMDVFTLEFEWQTIMIDRNDIGTSQRFAKDKFLSLYNKLEP